MHETDFGAVLCISIFHSQCQEGDSKIHCYWQLIVQIVGFYRLVAICEDIYAARAAGVSCTLCIYIGTHTRVLLVVIVVD